MTGEDKRIDQLLASLQERAKELTCLYRVEEALGEPDLALGEVCARLISAIPPGWQYPEVCRCRFVIQDQVFSSPGFEETPWQQHADVKVQGEVTGRVEVYYTQDMPVADDGPFLKEEATLLRTIADRLGNYLQHQRMREILRDWESARESISHRTKPEWMVVLEMMVKTDSNLHATLGRKMLNHLCWSGIPEAVAMLAALYPDPTVEETLANGGNRPTLRQLPTLSVDLSSEAFRMAAFHLSDNEILRLISKWIQDDKLGFLAQAVTRNLSLAEVTDAIRRYHAIALHEPEIQSPTQRGVQVSVIRRLLSDHLKYISVARDYIDVGDLYELLQQVIFAPESYGKLGGKSAGLFLASQILKQHAKGNALLAEVKTSKTLHLISDLHIDFMHFNNFDDVVEQKYKELNQIRLEYPHVVQTLKTGQFPPDIVKGLSQALDDFGDVPLIVRSSSLLEDQLGSSFSGKYKSLFLANRGDKRSRLEALADAIAEVYASTYAPDPIEYRTERSLLDFKEEMGIMIQQVVGRRVGRYYLPMYAGVAFSRNEFRWSPRLDRKDGLVRMVMGLGTRAVDRLADDFPVLVAPGQPALRANASPDEMERYSPRWIDVINLEMNRFETLPIKDFLREVEHELPRLSDMVSVLRDGRMIAPGPMGIDCAHDDVFVTFDGLITRTPFVRRLQAILHLLEQTLGYPVDIEFASDGTDFYLLQCRAQSYAEDSAPSPIPGDIPHARVLFNAKRYISNGRVPDVTHVVYVDPQAYSRLPDRDTMLSVGRAIGRLNQLLPRRQFILMGPGRWGSRGDIRLGVSVTYSDINNSSMLVEIARRQGNYVPELSFGTHFFQDLVEARIRYLPLYPDDEGITFNEAFLNSAENVLGDVAPEYAHLAHTVRVIDLARSAKGMNLRVLMNADLEEAVAFFDQPSSDRDQPPAIRMETQRPQETSWRWRTQMAERLASEMSASRFGVVGCYLLGSTKNATAGPNSDIDLLIHFRGTPAQRKELESWLEAWNVCLGEVNYIHTGYKQDRMLDARIVSDDDIEKKSGLAAKIDAVTDAARPLVVG